MSPSSPEPDTSFLRRIDRPLILYVIQQHDYSGAELGQVPVMRADADPLLACPPGSRTESLAQGLGVPTVPLPFRPLRHSGGLPVTLRSTFRGLASARDLRRALRAHPERTVIYCTAIRPGMLAALAGLGLRRRAIWFVTDFMPPGPLRPLTRLLARIGCDRAVAISRALASDFVGRSRRLARRTTVIYRGVDTTTYSAAASKPGSPRAAIIGHVSPTKRTDLAVDVAERVVTSNTEFKLEILGRAQYRQSDFAFERRLKDRVAGDARLREHVRFAGYVDDVPAELRRFGLVLHCRPDEPLGTALIQAMAAGLPVVAPAAGGPTEIVEDEVTGLLFPPGDAAAAAAQVVRLIDDPVTAARMGAAARAAAERRFAESRYVHEVEAVLAELAR